MNPFLKNQKIKAQEETPPKATQRKVKKKSVAGSIMESVDMAPKSSDVGQQKHRQKSHIHRRKKKREAVNLYV